MGLVFLLFFSYFILINLEEENKGCDLSEHFTPLQRGGKKPQANKKNLDYLIQVLELSGCLNPINYLRAMRIHLCLYSQRPWNSCRKLIFLNLTCNMEIKGRAVLTDTAILALRKPLIRLECLRFPRCFPRSIPGCLLLTPIPGCEFPVFIRCLWAKLHWAGVRRGLAYIPCPSRNWSLY